VAAASHGGEPFHTRPVLALACARRLLVDDFTAVRTRRCARRRPGPSPSGTRSRTPFTTTARQARGDAPGLPALRERPGELLEEDHPLQAPDPRGRLEDDRGRGGPDPPRRRRLLRPRLPVPLYNLALSYSRLVGPRLPASRCGSSPRGGGSSGDDRGARDGGRNGAVHDERHEEFGGDLLAKEGAKGSMRSASRRASRRRSP